MTNRKPIVIGMAAAVLVALVIGGLILFRLVMFWPYAFVHN